MDNNSKRLRKGVINKHQSNKTHFNPAVTVGFLITKQITKIQLLYYLAAEIIGALLASLFVKYVIGSEALLDANASNYDCITSSSTRIVQSQ